jgi:hypothetical protein
MVVELHADRDIYVYKVMNVDSFAKCRYDCSKVTRPQSNTYITQDICLNRTRQVVSRS